MVQMVWQSQIFLRFLSTLPDAFTHLLEKCTKFYFLKIEQLNKVSTLEVVQLVRDSVHTICDVCERKLDG